MKRFLTIAIIVLAIAAGTFYLLRPQPVAVAVTRVARGDVYSTVSNTRAGTVDACRRAGLSPALGGQIAALPVAKGDHVESGALLLQLWNDDLAASLTLAEREAQAARSQARQACVLASVARREADRLMRLSEQGLASTEDTERAVGNADANEAGCAAANDSTRVSAARVDVARAQLERTELRAPFAGVVAEINGELGEFVTPSPVGIPTPPTVDLIDASCLYISAPIDEVDAPAIKKGQAARISLDAFPNRSFDGHVRRVAPYVLDLEKQARTVEIEAEIDDPDNSALLPGYSADVEVLLDHRTNVLRVPTSIVNTDNRVFVFDPSTARLESRQISTGLSNWEFTEVTSGLAEGDQVVTSIDRAGVADGARARAE